MELLFLNLGTTELFMLIVPAFAFYLLGLIHCIANDNISGTNRVLWCLVIIALPIIGAVAYWFVGRKPAQGVA